MTSIGTIEIQDLFVGGVNAVGLYFGAVEVWSKDTPQPTSLNTKVKYTAASGLPDWEGDIVGELSSVSIPNISKAEVVVVGTDVTSIGSTAFRNNTSLYSIDIGDNVTVIKNQAFYGCSHLGKLSLGNSVAQIQSYAFRSCTDLTNVEFPASVNTIYQAAFYGCGRLSIADFRNHTQVPTLYNANAFDNVSDDFKIIVPDSLYSSWIVATNWSSLASKIVKASEA